MDGARKSDHLEEIKEGMMEKLTALAVIVEDEDKGKKRLKIRARGAREKKQLLLEMIDRGREDGLLGSRGYLQGSQEI